MCFACNVSETGLLASVVFKFCLCIFRGLGQSLGSVVAMMLGKIPVPGHSTNLHKSKARAYCTCSKCRWGLFGHFFSHLSSLSSFYPSHGRQPDID